MSTVSSARLDANRRNAQFSTGPRTAAGKARSSQNGVTLGLYSKQLLLAGEDPQQLQLLRDGMVESLQPSCVFETLLVDRIIAAAWKLQRLARAEQLLFLQGTVSRRNAFVEEVRNTLQLPSRQPTLQDGVRVMRYPALPQSLAADLMLAEANPALEKLQKHERQLENAILRWTKELRQFRKSKSAALGEEEANIQTEATDALTAPEPPPSATRSNPAAPTLENRQTEPTVKPQASFKRAAVIAAATSAVTKLDLGEDRMAVDSIQDLIFEQRIQGVERCKKERTVTVAHR